MCRYESCSGCIVEVLPGKDMKTSLPEALRQPANAFRPTRYFPRTSPPRARKLWTPQQGWYLAQLD